MLDCTSLHFSSVYKISDRSLILCLFHKKSKTKGDFEPVTPTPYTVKIVSLFSTDPKCFSLLESIDQAIPDVHVWHSRWAMSEIS